MDYDTTRRSPHNASLGFPHYYFTERNIPLAMSHVSRTDPRNCPVGGPAGGPRGRGIMGREDGAMESGQSRRRIAVAVSHVIALLQLCHYDAMNLNALTSILMHCVS